MPPEDALTNSNTIRDGTEESDGLVVPMKRPNKPVMNGGGGGGGKGPG